MKRNAVEKLKTWQESDNRPLFLYGIPGVGKTYLINDYGTNFHEVFFYYKPEGQLINGEITIEASDILDYLSEYFGLDIYTLKHNLIVFDDTELMPDFFLALMQVAIEEGYKWIFISKYNYINDSLKQKVFSLELFPVQFDEFLAVIGNEWYVEAIREHFKTRKKLPDIVHQELLSSFEEYIWLGGMPEVINEYSQGLTVNVTSRQKNTKLIVYDELNMVKDISLRGKCLQIVSSIEEQLYKKNRKFMFNLIRTGVTYQMYKEAMDLLVEKKLVQRITELSDEKKFKLFYPEFSFNSSNRSDEITEFEKALRTENYLLETFNQCNIRSYFWESGNRAELAFVIQEGEEFIPVEISLDGKNNSRSVQSYISKNNSSKTLKISDSNFVDEEDRFTIPIYACFCL